MADREGLFLDAARGAHRYAVPLSMNELLKMRFRTLWHGFRKVGWRPLESAACGAAARPLRPIHGTPLYEDQMMIRRETEQRGVARRRNTESNHGLRLRSLSMLVWATV